MKMGPPKGVRVAGRQKGTPNKKTQDLLDKANELGVDPFEVVLFYAKRDWKALGFSSETITRCAKGGETFEEDRITAKMQLDAATDACQYLYPKRKAVELSSDPENPIDLNVKVDAALMKDLVKVARESNGSK